MYTSDFGIESLKTITKYIDHPQSDDQTERVNKVIENMLQAHIVAKKPTKCE